MIEAVAVIVLMLFAYWLGWKHRDNWDWLRALWLKKAHTDVLEESRSSIVEPREETPAERAQREQSELIERLNVQ